MDEPRNAPSLPEPVKTRPAVVKMLLAAILAVLFVAFLIQNSDNTVFAFLGWEGELPLWLSLVISSLAGIVIWEFAGYLRRRRR